MVLEGGKKKIRGIIMRKKLESDREAGRETVEEGDVQERTPETPIGWDLLYEIDSSLLIRD